MPAFQPPEMTHTKNETWRQIAKPEFRNPNILWNDYWQRFNTMTVPILDEDAYFADALAAAKHAENREHLEELLADKHEERRRDIEQIVRNVALSSISLRQTFPSTATRDAALKIGQTGSLDSFLQFVCGVVFGWKDGHKEAPPAQVCSIDDNEADKQGHDDTGEDESEVGDPWEEQNTFPVGLCPSPDWEDQEDGWEGVSQRVTECYEADDTSERRLRPLSAMGADDTTLAMDGRGANEDEKISTQAPSLTDSSPCQPRSSSQRPTDNALSDTAAPSKDSCSSTSPNLAEAVSPYTSPSPGPSDVQAVDKPCPPENPSSPAGPGPRGQAGEHTQSDSLAIGTGSRKRSLPHESDEEQGRRKRRIKHVR